MIRIGTSGYSFKDWVGTFYPKGIKPGQMFDHYIGHFHTVEINSTYYRIPHAKVFINIANKAPEGFDFMVKVNRRLTHQKAPDIESMQDLFLAVEPLIDAGKIAGFVAQFPYSFKLSPDNLKSVIAARRACRGFPLFAEFRHISWAADEVYHALAENDVGYIDVDEPYLYNLIPPQSIVTNGTGYVRFHGRNRRTWWDSSEGDRYDYEYNEGELREWLPLIREIDSAASNTYLFFNNCHMGQAVKNAKMMRDILQKDLGLEAI